MQHSNVFLLLLGGYIDSGIDVNKILRVLKKKNIVL